MSIRPSLPPPLPNKESGNFLSKRLVLEGIWAKQEREKGRERRERGGNFKDGRDSRFPGFSWLGPVFPAFFPLGFRSYRLA